MRGTALGDGPAVAAYLEELAAHANADEDMLTNQALGLEPALTALTALEILATARASASSEAPAAR
ncbi:hypothetical protein ACWD6R_31240 [Streptomyces sp. NPDC005151]